MADLKEKMSAKKTEDAEKVKKEKTPMNYPRPYAQICKKPL